jgi:hypothetical protein
LQPAQRVIGDFSPRLVQLTDDVLFGPLWVMALLSAHEAPDVAPRSRGGSAHHGQRHGAMPETKA